jgi:DNA-binding response OmpR family regulator
MPKLLIIDDDIRSTASLAALLRSHGHDVYCAYTVGEALRQVRCVKPDLMLLDLGLPRVDGLELLEAVVGEPGLDGVSVVVYSARVDPAAVEAARRLGACDYLLKGGAWEETYRRIESCLAGAAAAEC